MKKANKLSGVKKTTQKGSATKTSSSTKPKRREAQGQGELTRVVEQLALSAERLAQAADRLTEAISRNSATGERKDAALGTSGESITDLTASEEELAEPPVGLTASHENAETADSTKDG
jgi:methyl-accepting chemotaxis protein